MKHTEMTIAERRRVLVGALRAYDYGDGCLGIIVDEALRRNPDVTVEEIEEICREAEEDARREAQESELGSRLRQLRPCARTGFGRTSEVTT